MTKFTYLSNYNNQGIPAGLNVDHDGNNILDPVSNNLLNEIGVNLPGGVTVISRHPEWIRKSDIYTAANCNILLSFVTEGAGYRNALGYYVYDKISPPNRFSDVSEIFIVLPNASLKNKGGELNAGDSMELVYEATTTSNGGKNYVDVANYVFPKDKGIGFVCFANGWKNNGSSSAYLNENRSMYSSDPALNPENDMQLKNHAVNFQSSVESDKIIYGFEDLRRDQRSDDDFNDMVYYIKPNPIEAIETYSINSLKAQVYDGFILCEDIKQGKGDFDYNDLTMKYNVSENILDNGNIQSIRINLQALYRGASFNHNFGVILAGIKNIPDCKIYRETYIYHSDTNEKKCITSEIIGGGTDKIPLIENSTDFLPSDAIFTNTESNSDLVNPSYSIVKIIFGKNGISRSVINTETFPYKFYLDVFTQVDGEDVFKYSIYSDETYESSSKMKTLGVNNKKKIMVLNDLHSFRIPFEKRNLKSAYPRLIKNLQNDSVYNSWYSESVARLPFLRDEIKHTDSHNYIDILNYTKVDPIVKVNDNCVIMQPTGFKQDFTFSDPSMASLLAENNFDVSNLMDWYNINSLALIDSIAVLIKSYDSSHIKRNGDYKLYIPSGDDKYYYVSLTSLENDPERIIHSVKTGTNETLELLSHTSNKNYALCLEDVTPFSVTTTPASVTGKSNVNIVPNLNNGTKSNRKLKFNHTRSAGSNNFLMVSIQMYKEQSVVSVKYGDEIMTLDSYYVDNEFQQKGYVFGLKNPTSTNNDIEIIFNAYVGNKVSAFSCSFKDSLGIGPLQTRVSSTDSLSKTFYQVSSGSILYSTIVSNTTIGTLDINNTPVSLEFGQHDTNKKNSGALYNTTHLGDAIDIPIVSTVADSFYNKTIEILGVIE